MAKKGGIFLVPDIFTNSNVGRQGKGPLILGYTTLTKVGNMTDEDVLLEIILKGGVDSKIAIRSLVFVKATNVDANVLPSQLNGISTSMEQANV